MPVQSNSDYITSRFIGSRGQPYVDGAEFTQLFRANASNRKKQIIADRLHLIAQNIAFGRFGRLGRSIEEPEIQDAASEATLLAIRKIWRFTRHCKHQNAFWYFSTLIEREMFRQLKMDSQRRAGLPPYSRKKKSAALADGGFSDSVLHAMRGRA